MKAKGKIIDYILRGGVGTLLFSCLVVVFSPAIRLRKHAAKVAVPQNYASFGMNGRHSAASVDAFGIKRNRTVTFTDRVAYRRAIEAVYWHCIWPEANAGTTPNAVFIENTRGRWSPISVEVVVGDFARIPEAAKPDKLSQPPSAVLAVAPWNSESELLESLLLDHIYLSKDSALRVLPRRSASPAETAG